MLAFTQNVAEYGMFAKKNVNIHVNVSEYIRIVIRVPILRYHHKVCRGLA